MKKHLLVCTVFAAIASPLFSQSNQNSGIGTVVPNSKLEIRGAGTTSVTSSLNVTKSDSTSVLFIRDDGKVGLGSTTPAEKLDVTGNVRFSGALMPNGLSGTSGQVLTSAGSGAVPTWTAASGGGLIGQSGAEVYGTGPLTNFSSTAFTLIPGLVQTINVPANSLLLINTNGAFETVSLSASGASALDVAIFIDGVVGTGSWLTYVAANTTGIGQNRANFSLQKTASLSAGSHTVEVRVKRVLGSAATVGGNSTSTMQGTLSVVTLKK